MEPARGAWPLGHVVVHTDGLQMTSCRHNAAVCEVMRSAERGRPPETVPSQTRHSLRPPPAP